MAFRTQAKGRNFLSRLPLADKHLVEGIMANPQYKGAYKVPQIMESIMFHRRTGIPLTLSLEIVSHNLDKGQFRNPRVLVFVRNAQDQYEIRTGSAHFVVFPSFFTRTGSSTQNPHHYGLNNFSWMSFRVLPAPEEQHLYKDKLGPMTEKDPYKSAIIVEIDLAEIGRRPVIVVTNAQATKDYYSLPWSLKKRFKGTYERTLEIISALENAPVLIPSNATVKEYLLGALGHTISDSVLNEFYDKFSEKRGRRKIKLKIRNPRDGRKIEAEFWCPAA